MRADNAITLPYARHPDRALWVGLFVLLGIGALLALVFLVTEPSTFQGRYAVIANVADAGGLKRGDPVQMRGVKIGQVRGFDIRQDGVSVRLEIDREFRIPRDSTIELRPNSLLGDMAVEVVPGKAGETLRGGEALAGAPKGNLISQLGGMAEQADQTLIRLQQLLSDETIDNVQTSTSELRALVESLSQTVEGQREDLSALSKSLRRSAQGLEKTATGPELQRSIERLDGITERLTATGTSLARAAQSAEAVALRIERGEGSLGRLTQDDSLYRNANDAILNLSRAAEEMVKLTEDVRKQPKRYFDFSIF